MKHNTVIKLFVLILFVESCNSDSLYWDLPTVDSNTSSVDSSGNMEYQLQTLPINGISANGANCGGHFVSLGNETIISKGICYSTQPNPTIDNSVINAGNGGNADFTIQITNLTSLTEYFVKSFATNSSDTIYGNELSFSTSSPPATLISTMDCSSLNGVSSYYDGINNSTGEWGLSSSGYNGDCFVAPNPDNSGNLGMAVGTHFIEFDKAFSNNGYLEIWLNTFKAGSDNLIPEIYIDNYPQNSPTIIEGAASSFNWMKVRTEQISAGQHSIRIQFSGSYYVFKLDEIQQFEY